ncbi:MAG: plasmid mobilization relaxosome protein MobC [Phycisphaerales bacterium]|nr:plasmid mobilization relaxosome protein MobC [Phycisphaerales bacterium]
MVRPTKIADEKRSLTIRVRVTAAEKKTLVTASENEGYSLSDFMRLKSIHAVPRSKKATPERAALIRGLGELSKLGSNLNQIARALNRRQQVGELQGFSSELLQSLLQQTDRLSAQLLNLLEHGH